MCAKRKSAVPQNIHEEYYQISSEILSSFPKYRPPVDLFFFDEDIAVLSPFSHKGARLTNEQVEEVNKLCDDGNLFVSRSDHDIYSEHIVKQLDLVLQDQNLKEAEIVNICIKALIMRYDAFFQQPVKPVFEALQNDVLVVTEYLFEDKKRIGAFIRRLFRTHTPANHAFNTLISGLWIWIHKTKDIQRKNFDNVAVALITHDIGMSKIQPFLINKNGPLKNEDKEKVSAHAFQGAKIMQKQETGVTDILQAAFQHHERLDGSGYPQRLKDEQILPIGRLVAVADSFSAMITDRPYAKAMDPLKAATELSTDPRYDNSLARLLTLAFATNQVTV